MDDSGSVTGGDYCLGFVETKSTNASKSNQLHVEKILGFGDRFKTEPCVTGVTVVWCATSDLNETQVVGWYKNATVFREYQTFEDEHGKERFYNILSLSSDCTLLPQSRQDSASSLYTTLPFPNGKTFIQTCPLS